MTAGAGASINPSSTGLSLTTTGEVGWLVCVDDTVGANVFDFVTGGASGGGVSGPERYDTLAITTDLTLTTAHLGMIIYTVSGTSADIDITVPTGLGDGFHCSFIHRGTGVFQIVASGTTINEPAGGTLTLPTNGRASIMESGGANIFDVVGVVVAA